MSTDSSSLSADINLAHDPYERFLKEEKFAKNLVPFDSSSKFAKKWARFSRKLQGARDQMMQGAIMGFMVGGLFGLVIGCYSAVTTRRFAAIPISIIVSGSSFGFILGCGSMIRADSVDLQMGNGLKEEEWMSVMQFNNRSRSLDL